MSLRLGLSHIRTLGGALALAAGCSGPSPAPAAHVCLDLTAGTSHPLLPPTEVYGAGLTYAGHLRETGQSATEVPPLFRKAWSPTTAQVPVPTPEQLRQRMGEVEPGLSAAMKAREVDLTPLLDWEVELGLVLLEDYTPGRPPSVGFFVANDLSERSLAVLGEGRHNRMAYWGASKSHPGFLPATQTMWVPHQPVANGIPCVSLRTRVNGEVRQSASTTELVYTTTQLLDAVTADRGAPPRSGTWLLTGTPSGVAIATPAWQIALADLAGLDRFSRLSSVQGRAPSFLSAGDVVEVDAEGLGSVQTSLVAP